MQGLWYGDKRDRVKWGALVHLANTKGIRCVVQVAYFRHGTDLKLQTEEGEVELPVQVWNHFSNLRHIERLGEATGLKIIVLDQLYDPGNRSDYINMIGLHLEEINKEIKSRKIIFLDPDTGIAPGGKGNPEHVIIQDIKDIWGALSSGDLIVIYQHADRTKKWVPDRKDKMSFACRGAGVEIISGEDIASDVAMLWCRKGPTAKPDPKTPISDLVSAKTSDKEKGLRPCACQCGERREEGKRFLPRPRHETQVLLPQDDDRKVVKECVNKIILKMHELWEKDKSRPLKDIASEVLKENEHGQNPNR